MQSALRIGAVWLFLCAGLVGAVQLGLASPTTFDTLLARMQSEIAERPPLAQAVLDRGGPDTGRLTVLERSLPELFKLAHSDSVDAARARAVWISASAELQDAGWESPLLGRWWVELDELTRSSANLDWLATPAPELDLWAPLRARASEQSAELLERWANHAHPASLRARVLFEWALAQELCDKPAEADAIRAELIAVAPTSLWGRRAARARAAAQRWSIGQPVDALELRDLCGNTISIESGGSRFVLLACPAGPDPSAIQTLGSRARELGPSSVHIVLFAARGTQSAWRRATESYVNVLDVADALLESELRPVGLLPDHGAVYLLLDSKRTLIARSTDPGPLLAQVETALETSLRSADR